jgi:hypothetical protein
LNELLLSAKKFVYVAFTTHFSEIGPHFSFPLSLIIVCMYDCLQAAQDGVDIISLSITPNRRPPGVATFFNPIDMALLSAVKAGIFVVQAAGNTGPSPMSMSSFSPWILTVGAASHDRLYSNSISLGNNVTIPGVGLARKFMFLCSWLISKIQC